MKISLLIIAGGKSSRLGTDKRFVEVGGVGLLAKILRKAQAIDFAEKFLCVEEELPALKILAARYGVKILVDEIKNSGAMAGLVNGLKQFKTDWALAVAADMPFFDFETINPLKENFSSAQAVVPVIGGKTQPLAAFYRREVAEIFLQEILNGQRKLLAAIKKIPHVLAELPNAENFFNVNTPADLRFARGRAENLLRTTPIISIVAPESGTGKTTFIERLIKIFSAQGIRVGVIKSDAHGFTLDHDGKDSQKFQAAGAKSVAVVSPQSWFMIQTDTHENFFAVAEKMSGVDLILTESRTKNFFPTISLWRGFGEVIADEKVAAIFTIKPFDNSAISQFDLNDFAAAEKVCKFLAGLQLKESDKYG